MKVGWGEHTPWGAPRETFSHLVMILRALLCVQVSLSATFESQWIQGETLREEQTFLLEQGFWLARLGLPAGDLPALQSGLPHNCSIPLARKIKPCCERRNSITSLWNDSGSLLIWWISPCGFPSFSMCKCLCDFFFLMFLLMSRCWYKNNTNSVWFGLLVSHISVSPWAAGRAGRLFTLWFISPFSLMS